MSKCAWVLVVIFFLGVWLLSVGEYHFKDTLEWQYDFAYEVGYQQGLLDR